MEEVSVNRVEKYSKVEQKLEQLAQVKLQGINTSTLRKVEDRLLTLEKGLCEQTATSEKTVREYRLMLRKYEEQWEEVSARCHESSLTRVCKLAELKELMADYFSRENTVPFVLFRIARPFSNRFHLPLRKKLKGLAGNWRIRSLRDINKQLLWRVVSRKHCLGSEQAYTHNCRP